MFLLLLKIEIDIVCTNDHIPIVTHQYKTIDNQDVTYDKLSFPISKLDFAVWARIECLETKSSHLGWNG